MTPQYNSSQLSELGEMANAGLSSHAVVAELGQAALDGVPTSSLVGAVPDVLSDILGVEFSTILLRDRTTDPWTLAASHGCDEDAGLNTLLAAPESFVEPTLTAVGPVVHTDSGDDDRFGLLVDCDVASAASVRIPGRSGPFGVLSIYSTQERTFATDDLDFLRSVANILGSSLQSEEDARAQRRHIRYQAALAECAQILLVGSGENQLDQAAAALLSATEAESVFIERNVVHPELGLCSMTVAEADRLGSPAAQVDPDYDYWDLIPWDRMPTSRSYLERGEPYFLVPDELEGVEAELYSADPLRPKAELDIPIFVKGEWAGLVAFSESEFDRDWEQKDLSLLTAAAQMVGAFWEAEVAREELEHLVASKDQLIASVSHELRTPLTSVIGFAKLLEKEGSGLSDEERAGVIRTIAEEGVDLANIVDDLLVAAKAESGILEVVAVPIDLRAQVAQVVEACRPADAERITMSVHRVRTEGDPARIRQILRNLISNALRHGGERIRIELGNDEDGTAVVRVIDNGPGIPPDEWDRVFESYYRGEEDPGLAGSMGLGLTISRELAIRMGGGLSYGYAAGESTFELRLPPTE